MSIEAIDHRISVAEFIINAWEKSLGDDPSDREFINEQIAAEKTHISKLNELRQEFANTPQTDGENK